MKSGESHDLSSGVTIQNSTRTRSFAWEDEAPAEIPARHPRADAPVRIANRRTAEAAGPDAARPDQDTPETRRPVRRNDSPFEYADEDAPRWWRPSRGWARAFFALGTLLLLGGLTVGGWLLRNFLEHDGRFRIAGTENIQATGLNEVSRMQMLPVFGEDIGRNVFFIPLAERRRQLEEIPWVEEATVMRLLPDQIRVSVVERKPVAFVRVGGEVKLVDAEGVVLPMSAAAMARHHYSFPVVTGVNPHDPPAASKNRMAVYERLITELDAHGQHLSAQISEVDLTDPEDARVLMPAAGGDILAHFGEDHFLDRYQRYKAHIAEWLQQYPKLTAVDLRYDQQVVLEMAPAADARAAAQGSATAAAVERSEEKGRTAGAPGKKARARARNAAEKRREARAHSQRLAARRAALKKRQTAHQAAVRWPAGE